MFTGADCPRDGVQSQGELDPAKPGITTNYRPAQAKFVWAAGYDVRRTLGRIDASIPRSINADSV
jgi:hypothetical protein